MLGRTGRTYEAIAKALAIAITVLGLMLFAALTVGVSWGSSRVQAAPADHMEELASGSAQPEETTCQVDFQIVPSPNATIGGSTLRSVSALSSNDVWAAGFSTAYISGTLQTRTLIEHWNGTGWSIVPSPNTASSTNNLFGISALSSNDVWAVGYCDCGSGPRREQSLIMHWDGSQWSIVPGPAIASGYHFLNSVSAVSANDIWAVGTNAGNTLIAHWDGTQWTVVPSPNVGTANYLNGVSALGANDVWAVGYYYTSTFPPVPNQTLTLHWNGVEWSVVPSPNAPPIGGVPSTNTLQSVSALAPNDVWAVGYYYIQDRTPNRTLVLHWDGSAWSIIPSPNQGISDNVLWGVSAASSNDVWAVGAATTSSPDSQPLVLYWDGSQWSINPSPNPGSGQNRMWGVDALTASNVWTVGERNSGQTLVMHGDTCVAPTPTPPPSATATPVQFSDVPPDSPFYSFIQCLASRGIISGYADGTFRPGNNVTRGQLSKIVSNSAGFSDPPGAQLFTDVPPGSTFYDWVQRLASRGYISGYECGSVGEPCDGENRPYFRPGNNATRGQISKIVSNTAGYADPPGAQIFEDVLPGSTFYEWVQRLASRGYMGGYPCGGMGEPCLTGKPYFRPNNNATRGQTSKTVANTFFPACQAR